jgi:6-phosphofructokinase 1
MVKDPNPPAFGIGNVSGELRMTPLDEVMRMADEEFERPREQWWMRLRPVARMMAQQQVPDFE